ncbi:TPA: DUF550 domain-containing protein [Klebsiella pneumoniae]|nr:Eaa1 [Klebsiella pneumoniae]HBT0098394.1 DUF550 domain-containing protein [Klebsiella pneumoniae]
MTKSTITRERLEKIKSWRETYGAGSNVMLPAEEAEELASMALAAMDSEPVVKKVACWSCQNEVEIAAISDCDGCCPKCGTRIHLDEEPYIAPLSAPDRDQVRREHAEWSQATFGNVGPVGPLKHLRREVLETIAKPHDLIEWADMQFLLWDAQRRAGITDEQITQAMIDKLAVNKQREWPEPKDGEPRLHIKEQPAPVVPENCVTAEHRRVIEMLLNVCGAAFELADDSCQQDVDGGDCHVVPDDSFQKLSDALDEIENTLPTEDIDRPSVFLAWSAMPRAALKSILQAGNPPVIPDGYVMVPMRLTAENGAKGALSGEFSETKFVNCPECFGDDECETCDGSGRIEITVPVTWTTIKEIWAKGVEHFSATPREVKGE